MWVESVATVNVWKCWCKCIIVVYKNRVPTSLFHHVGGVCSYSKCVENVGVNVLLLYIKNRVPTSLFHHVGGVCSYSKCVENVGVNVLLLHIKIEFRRVCFTMWEESVATVNV